MFQGPKDYIAQMCEVHLQYGNSTTKWPFYSFFRVNSTLINSILFGTMSPWNLSKLGIMGEYTFICLMIKKLNI